MPPRGTPRQDPAGHDNLVLGQCAEFRTSCSPQNLDFMPVNPSPSSSIRPAIPADAPTIASFNAAMALETEHKRLDPAILRAGVERALAQPDAARYFLAEIAGQVAGQ